MKRHWTLALFGAAGLIVAVCVIIPLTAKTSFKSTDFPLEKKWSTRLGGNVVALSTGENSTLYVRAGRVLYALEMETGKVVWQRNLSWQPDPKPAKTKNGRVYVPDGDQLLALNQEDGSVLWSQPLSGPDAWITDVSTDFVVVEDRGIYKIYDAVQGSMLSKTGTCWGYIQAYIDGNVLYFGCKGIIAFNVITSEIYREEVDGYVSDVGYENGVLYYSPLDRSIEAFDMKNHTKLWETPRLIRGLFRLLVIGDHLYLTDASSFCQFQLKDGQEEWCAAIQYPQDPTVLGNIVYIFNGNSTGITAIDELTGEIVGELELENLNHFSMERKLMVASAELLFFGSGREVFAFDK